MEEIKQSGTKLQNGDDRNEIVYIRSIDFGNYEIDTTLPSDYEIDTTLPSDYQDTLNQHSYTSGDLYVCEFCLLYKENLQDLTRHKTKCKWTHPKEKEIYRDEKLSVFELDGEGEEVYCSRLCLFSKLFLLDKKSCCAKNFFFYVLMLNTKGKKKLIGYFSKEKEPCENHNMSCLLILPQYQRKGYGRFLIHLSYILSRREGIPGTPEKPLSKLGLLCFHSYWRSTIASYVYRHLDRSSITVKEISKHTGIDPFDVGTTLQMLGLVKQRNGSVCIAVKPRALLREIQSLRRKNYHQLNEKHLSWSPTSTEHVNGTGIQSETSSTTEVDGAEFRSQILSDDCEVGYNSKKMKLEI